MSRQDRQRRLDSLPAQLDSWDLEAADPALRAAAAASWARVAQAEHGSIAAFNRLSLQLLALGAPADLLRDTQRAALDEVEHAELAFGVASRLAGIPLGPERYELSAARFALEELAVCTPLALDGVLREAIVDGAIGETVAALEVRAAAARTTVPCLRALLGLIADDEAQHGELGFRVVGWLLEEQPELRPRAVAHFDAALGQLVEFIDPEPATSALEPFGRIGLDLRRRIRQEARLHAFGPLRTSLAGG